MNIFKIENDLTILARKVKNNCFSLLALRHCLLNENTENKTKKAHLERVVKELKEQLDSLEELLTKGREEINLFEKELEKLDWEDYISLKESFTKLMDKVVEQAT